MQGETNGRHGWVVLCYFFLGALLGLFVTTVSAVVAVGSMVAGEGEGVAGALMAALVGLVVLYIHLTQGLKRSRGRSEGSAPVASDARPSSSVSATASGAGADAPPLWPRAVYFHVGALVGLIAAVSGAVGMSGAIASLLFGGPEVPEGFSEFGGYPGLPSPGQDLVKNLLITAVGVLIMWWHLNEARKPRPLTRAGSDPSGGTTQPKA